MKYYLIEISTGDAKITGKAIYEYEDEQTAIATFHQKLGNAMKSDLFETELVMVMDDKGFISKFEKYINPNYVNPEIPEI